MDDISLASSPSKSTLWRSVACCIITLTTFDINFISLAVSSRDSKSHAFIHQNSAVFLPIASFIALPLVCFERLKSWRFRRHEAPPVFSFQKLLCAAPPPPHFLLFWLFLMLFFCCCFSQFHCHRSLLPLCVATNETQLRANHFSIWSTFFVVVRKKVVTWIFSFDSVTDTRVKASRKPRDGSCFFAEHEHPQHTTTQHSSSQLHKQLINC